MVHALPVTGLVTTDGLESKLLIPHHPRGTSSGRGRYSAVKGQSWRNSAWAEVLSGIVTSRF